MIMERCGDEALHATRAPPIACNSRALLAEDLRTSIGMDDQQGVLRARSFLPIERECILKRETKPKLEN
jgi:hypothetical protein